MEQIDITVRLNVERITAEGMQALRRATTTQAELMAGGVAVDSSVQLVADEVAARDWDNSLTREFAWLVADREEDDAAEVIEWIHENENDYPVWDRVSKMIDELTDAAKRS